jgi:hypothetical protein
MNNVVGFIALLMCVCAITFFVCLVWLVWSLPDNFMLPAQVGTTSVIVGAFLYYLKVAIED